MPRFIIKISHQQNLLFEIPQTPFLIGRGEHTELLLPNVSVSREHARVWRDDQGVHIEDVNSQNGLSVNGESINQHTLHSGDLVEIGNFTFVFLTDSPKDRFWRGRAVAYLPAYDKASISTPNAQATHQLSPEMAERMRQGNHLMHTACVTRADTQQYWFPEGHALTFGDGRALVSIGGILVRGNVASIQWSGQGHNLLRSAAMVATTHNGRKLRNNESVRLRPGDQFQVGTARFTYDLRLD